MRTCSHLHRSFSVELLEEKELASNACTEKKAVFALSFFCRCGDSRACRALDAAVPQRDALTASTTSHAETSTLAGELTLHRRGSKIAVTRARFG